MTVGNPSAGVAVIGRPLIDGSWALALLNAGPLPTVVGCDSTCLQQTGFEVSILSSTYSLHGLLYIYCCYQVGQVLAVRDLWAGAALPDIIVGTTNITTTLDADGGAALYRVTPIFNATIPL